MATKKETKKEIKKETKNDKNKNGTTELVFILDKSGSMEGLESDTIGGFNSMISKQKQDNNPTYVSTVLFSSDSEVIHDRVSLSDIKPMTNEDYYPSGCTALIDAIGCAIHHISNVHKYAREEDIPDNTVFVIMTDGYENASHIYSSDKVKKMIKEKQKKYGWEFLFIGANIDAVETAANFGIDESRAVNYHADKIGTKTAYKTLACSIQTIRGCGVLEENWAADIESDYKSRK